MAIARAQVVIPRDTLLPEDVSINTWHFRTPGDFPIPTQLDAILAALVTFYGVIDQYLATIHSTPALVKWYSMGDAKPRQPIRTDTFAVTTATGNSYPEEVALCVSFQADALSGQLQRRRRGRIYLGPLDSAVGTPTGGRMLVVPTVATTIAAAAGALLASSVASADWSWVVYSPTTAALGASPDDASFDVGNGWVDNAFDTQRRRGPKATARTTFT